MRGQEKGVIEGTDEGIWYDVLVEVVVVVIIVSQGVVMTTPVR